MNLEPQLYAPETYTVKGHCFTVREFATICVVEVSGLLERFDNRSEALMWIYCTTREATQHDAQ